MRRVGYAFLLFWAIALWRGSAYGVDMVIMPIQYYERQGNSYQAKTYRQDITGDVREWIGRYHGVREGKTGVQDRLAGVTDTDARRAADHYEVNYVLYGVVKEEGQTLTAEFKVYDARQERYELFFAGDKRDKYERLIQAVCEHILEWFHTDRDKVETLRNEVRDLRKELDLVREAAVRQGRESAVGESGGVEEEFSLALPVGVGYWTYTGREWVGLVRGTVEVNLGVELFPKLQLPEVRGRRNEFSWSMMFGYRYGVGANEQEVQAHELTVNPMLGYHINFYTMNWFLAGLGVFFEYGQWRVEEKDYRQTFAYDQLLTGISVLLEYRYRFNRRVAINAGGALFCYFATDTSPVIRVYAGATVTVVGGRYEQ